VAYGIFGVSDGVTQVGAEAIVTTDLKLAVRYSENFGDIERRFEDMLSSLPAAYTSLTLPRVLTTTDVLTKF